MGKLLKIILGMVALVAGLILVLALVLPMIIDPNDYKDQIAAVVKDDTGRTLHIDGKISLSVFPWLGLEIGPTRLSNAPGFGDQPMASIDKVEVRVKLLPLLHKQLEMDTLRLSGLQLRLGRDASGRSNWDDLLGKSGGKTPTGTSRPGAEGGSPLAGLAIGGVKVSDARVLWDDRSTGAHYEIKDLSFTTGAIAPGKPFDLDLHFGMDARQPAIAGRTELRGKVMIAESLQAVTIDGAQLKLDLNGRYRARRPAAALAGDGYHGRSPAPDVADDEAFDRDAGTEHQRQCQRYRHWRQGSTYSRRVERGGIRAA